MGVLCLSLFCYALLCILSSFTIILKRKRELVVLLLLSNECLVNVNIMWLCLMVLQVGLQCVIVVFPDHTHLLFICTFKVLYFSDIVDILPTICWKEFTFVFGTIHDRLPLGSFRHFSPYSRM